MSFVSQLTDFRAAKDDFFRSEHSPLPDELRDRFQGLAYFEQDPALVSSVPVLATEPGDVTVGTSDGHVRSYRRAGQIEIEVGDRTIRLLLLQAPGDDGFFIPFRDGTSGSSTYGAGRYLDVEPAEDGTVEIDFNLAYNPYCAYSDEYSCPLPPHENWLTVPIEAGERAYEG